MSAAEDSVVCTPMCQGFLKKRKDKMRLKWVTYWFKLHNTTLFFYNKKHGSILELRGQYYLIEIESVHEVMWTKKKDYIFEIAMKNGKRKVLAAETAALRQLWISQLLQAIKPHVYDPTELSCMHSDSVMPTPVSSIYTDIDMSRDKISQDAEDEGKQKAEVTELENPYDVLPPFKHLNSSEEVIYDTPPSNRRLCENEQETAEGIYDVPKYAIQKRSVNEAPCAKESPEIPGLLHDMVTCLGGNAAAWVRVTVPETIYQTWQNYKDHQLD